MIGDELLDLVELVARDITGIEQALHHGGERAVEGMLERVEQFTALRLRLGHRRAIKRDMALFRGGEQPLAHHAIHERANCRIRPRRLLEQLLLDGGRRAGFVGPDGFNDGPLGFSQFNGRLRHGVKKDDARSLLYSCRAHKQNLYKCRGQEAFCAAAFCPLN